VRWACEIVDRLPTEPTVRPARRDDAASLTRMHGDFGHLYAELAPAGFHVPDDDGLVEYRAANVDRDPSTLWLVAELGGGVVGVLYARLTPPYPAARRELDPALAGSKLQIDYLVTDERHRRRGIGATVATTATYAESPLSAPFWQERIGYRTRSLLLVRPLA